MDIKELTLIQNTRDVIFNIFSQVFADIPTAISDNLISNTCTYLFEACWDTDNADLKAGSALLAEFFTKYGDLENTNSQRCVEYTGLFLMGNNNIDIHESVYLSSEHLFMQEQWFEVKKAYASEKFRLADDCMKMEDHLSLELEFMAHLSNKAVAGLENSDFDEAEKCLKSQLLFSNEHIFKWVPQFCERVISANTDELTGYYASFAYLLQGYIREDRTFLEDILE